MNNCFFLEYNSFRFKFRVLIRLDGPIVLTLCFKYKIYSSIRQYKIPGTKETHLNYTTLKFGNEEKVEGVQIEYKKIRFPHF